MFVLFFNFCFVAVCLSLRVWPNDQTLLVELLKFACEANMFYPKTLLVQHYLIFFNFFKNFANQIFAIFSCFGMTVLWRGKTIKHYCSNIWNLLVKQNVSALGRNLDYYLLSSNVLWCDQTFKHCLMIPKFQMFDTKCLIVLPGPPQECPSLWQNRYNWTVRFCIF